MMNPKELSIFFDLKPDRKVDEDYKQSCKVVGEIFNKLTNNKKDNIFLDLASDNAKPFSDEIKFEVPGEDACKEIEKMRQAIFNSSDNKTISLHYYNSYMKVLSYILSKASFNEIEFDDAYSATMAFYDTYASKCFKLDETLYLETKNGKVSSYFDFFKSYLKNYRESMSEVICIPSFGVRRNDAELYRKSLYCYIEWLLSSLVLFSYVSKLILDSYSQFIHNLSDEILNSSDLFYKHWIKVNTEVITKAYGEEEFSTYLFDNESACSDFLIASKKLYEANLRDVPIGKESDIKELSKTVYDLKKEIQALKKEIEVLKNGK